MLSVMNATLTDYHTAGDKNSHKFDREYPNSFFGGGGANPRKLARKVAFRQLCCDDSYSHDGLVAKLLNAQLECWLLGHVKS